MSARTFRLNPLKVEVAQWFANGDHPGDNVGELLHDDPFGDAAYARQEGAVVRYFRHPDFSGDQRCPHGCGHVLHDHGWIDQGAEGRTVCPGDWIITVGGEHYPCRFDLFSVLIDGATGRPMRAVARIRALTNWLRMTVIHRRRRNLAEGTELTDRALHQRLLRYFEEPLNRTDARSAADTALSAIYRERRFARAARAEAERG